MKTKQALQTILILGAVALAASSQGQTLLYDNGPVNGTGNARAINNGNLITDSFTLPSDSTLAGATIGIWNISGDSLAPVQWSITTAPFGGTTLASGTATTTDTFLFLNQNIQPDSFSIYSDSFSLASTSLAAGTYWLQLGNGAILGVNNDYVYWDINDGPSSAHDGINGPFDTGILPSESFQLYGTITNAPEPSTMALAMLGGLSLLGFRRRK